jgi:hypothetical protein
VFKWIISFECSSDVICASVIVKSGLENPRLRP